MRHGTRGIRWSWTATLLCLAGCGETPTEPGDTMAGVDDLASAPAPPGGLPKIVFTAYGVGGYQVWTINSNGTALKKVTQGPYHDGVRNSTEMSGAVWSPAGQSRIAFGLTFETPDYFHTRLMLISPNGTGLTWLTPPDVDAWGIQWSPNGTKLAFRGGDTTNLNKDQISVVNADGTGLLTIASDPTFISVPAWTPNGSRIAYFTETDNPWTLQNERGIWSETPDGTTRTKLVTVAPGTTRYLSFRFSPDGTRLAICKSANGYQGPFTLLIMNSNGTGQVSFALKCLRPPEWSPNGLRVLTVSNGDVYSVSPDGNDGEKLTAGGDVGAARWSPNGSLIAFERNLRIWVMNAGGTAENQITDSLQALDLSWSP